MKKTIRFILSVIAANLIRIVKVFPNNDPIFGFMLPLARDEKWWVPFTFPILTMVSFDLITKRLGIWTVWTSLTYGGIALLANMILKDKKIRFLHYIGATVMGVLIFDFVTGPIMSTLVFKMSFYAAFFGQIPFTLMHLVSSVTFSAVVCPLLDPDARLFSLKSVLGDKYRDSAKR